MFASNLKNVLDMNEVNDLLFSGCTFCNEVEEIDTKLLVSNITAFTHISNMSTFAIDYVRHRLLYCSDHLIYINEAVASDKKRECPVPYWSLISDNTLEKFFLIRNNYLQPGQGISFDDYRHHVCTIDYPIMINNHELFITQKFTPLVVNNDGIIKAGLFTISSSNKKEMICTIFSTADKRFHFDFEKNRFEEYNIGINLSDVEKAIIYRIKMGMTNEEIAKNLFISVNTVKTHRTHIFHKLHVDTINEALTVVENYHLL